MRLSVPSQTLLWRPMRGAPSSCPVGTSESWAGGTSPNQ
jgi:hypothetical protein